MKTCGTCGKEKPHEAFVKRTELRKGRTARCKQCQRAYYAAHPHQPVKVRAQRLLRDYGLTAGQYAAMVEKQNGRCAICEHAETFAGPNGLPNPLSIDHDHTSRQVRELLCGRCNRALGLLKEDPELFIRAAAYLARHGKPVGAEAENTADSNPVRMQ